MKFAILFIIYFEWVFVLKGSFCVALKLWLRQHLKIAEHEKCFASD